MKSPQWTGWGARGIAQGRRPGYEDFARQTSRGQRALRFSHQDVRSARREPSDRLPPIVSSIGVHIRDVSPIAHSINNYRMRKGSARVRTENVAIGKVLRGYGTRPLAAKPPQAKLIAVAMTGILVAGVIPPVLPSPHCRTRSAWRRSGMRGSTRDQLSRAAAQQLSVSV